MLEAEQAEEETVLRERLANWSVERLKEEGYCITGMSAYWMDAREYGRPVASFALGPGMDLPDSRFEGGTQVLVTRLDPLKEEPMRGNVLSRTSTKLQVIFPELYDLSVGTWRLDVGRSNMVYERMRTAIQQLNLDPATQEAHISPAQDRREIILQGTHLRDVLLRSFSPQRAHAPAHIQAEDDVAYASHETLEHPGRLPGEHGGAFKDDMRIQSWARRHAAPNPVRVEGDPVLSGLNGTQIRAIAMMIGERASLVQGPPGTGKTRTIIEAVRLLKIHFEVACPILVCTYTNVAVDNLVEGLLAAGVKPLRVGFGGKVSPKLYPHTLEAKLETHPLKSVFEKLVKELDHVQKRLDSLQKQIQKHSELKRPDLVRRLDRMESHGIAMERQITAVKSKLYALRQEMLHDIVSSADVICTTCVTSSCNALRVVDFPVVFLDEASMSTEPASLIPIMKGSRHVALIGDHKQLPPVITSREAQVKGLGISLFERLTEEGEVPSIMLDLQYRMHPEISKFPSKEFYNHTLLDGTVDGFGNILSSLYPPSSVHLQAHPVTGHRPSVVFLDHDGYESFKDRSRVNWSEAHIVCTIVEDLLRANPTLSGDDIGIIAPYVAQISVLTRMLNTDIKWQERFRSVLGEHRALQLGRIEVKTVDGFEGREKDIIVFSTVRNNTSGQIGFLADRRRLNVGLTRAKRGLFVVGSLRTLREGRTGAREGVAMRVGKGAEAWRKYAQYVTAEGLVMSVNGLRARRAGGGVGQPGSWVPPELMDGARKKSTADADADAAAAVVAAI